MYITRNAFVMYINCILCIICIICIICYYNNVEINSTITSLYRSIHEN